jgi:single-stranded-DNA-specific exonuclease
MDDAVWKIAPPREEAALLAAALGVPLPVGQVLANRGISDPAAARRFLHGTLDDVPDPFLMTGMAAAADRILAAVDKGELILIFGDYDADGILATVMLHKALASLGGRVDHFIPERLKDGYGLKDDHIAVATERGARLVISVDCGIKAVGFVRKARELGVDVIITDHHLPGDELPAALAVLDPAVPGTGYPERNLAGVGVAFKLIQALFQRTGRTAVLRHYLKLVSIGTIADVAELRGENRILVKHGLRELGDVANAGLQSLIDVCGLHGRRISEGDVGFRLGPRINAAGRLGRTEVAVRLFFSDSPTETAALAKELDLLNGQRQAVEERTFRQAAERVRANAWDRSYRILILGDEEWHRGIVGIVASKLKEAFVRPVILFSYDDGTAYGSGRSFGTFSLIDCLEECRRFFKSFGGHRLAVGCTLRREDMPAFKEAANAVASARITDDDLRRTLAIDARLGFAEMDAALWDGLSLLDPYGVGNPRPVFLTEGAEVSAPPRKIQNKHAKFVLRQGGRAFEAIAWDRAGWADKLGKGDRVDLAYTFQTSNYLGEERLYLNVDGLRPA